MKERSTLVLLLLLATLSSCTTILNKRGELYDMVGEWIVTSVLDYPTDIYMRVDTNDVHFQYGSMNQKIFLFIKSANMGVKFLPIYTVRNVNNETYPNEKQVDAAFASVTNYEFLNYDNQDLILKDALGRSLFHLVNKDTYKARSQRNSRRGGRQTVGPNKMITTTITTNGGVGGKGGLGGNVGNGGNRGGRGGSNNGDDDCGCTRC